MSFMGKKYKEGKETGVYCIVRNLRRKATI
jgi:hypothetical protein